MIFSLKLAKKARIMNLLIAIQLAVVFALIITMMSAIEDRTVYYSKFEEALSENGILIIPNIASDKLTDEESVFEAFGKATAVTGGKANLVTIEDDRTGYGYMTYYGKEIMDDLSVYLKEGSLPDPNAALPQCLVCDNFGYKVGDTVKLTDYDGVSFEAEICGIMSDNQRIYGTGGPDNYTYEDDYRDFYYQLTSSMRNAPLFLSTDEILNGAGSFGRYDFYSLLVVNFPEGAYTVDEIAQIASEYGFDYFNDTDVYYENSEAYMNQELYTFFPIALSILVITLFTAVTTTVVATMQNLKSYAVLYLSGATWRMCSVINFINYISIAVITVIADAVFFIIGKDTILKNTVVKTSAVNIGACGIILAVFLLLSLITPLLVVRNKQPRDVLKTEFRH